MTVPGKFTGLLVMSLLYENPLLKSLFYEKEFFGIFSPKGSGFSILGSDTEFPEPKMIKNVILKQKLNFRLFLIIFEFYPSKIMLFFSVPLLHIDLNMLVWKNSNAVKKLF